MSVEDRRAVGVEGAEPFASEVSARPGLRRRRDRALVGGVCAGLADYLEVEPVVVRVFLIVVALASGIGFVVYPLAWALIPATAAGAISYGSRPWRARFSAWRETLGIGPEPGQRALRADSLRGASRSGGAPARFRASFRPLRWSSAARMTPVR